MAQVHDRTVRRGVAVGLVAPLVVTIVAVAVQGSLLGSVPERVASHWGATGVDGTMPAWAIPVLTLALAGGLPLLMATVSVAALRGGERGFVLRFLIAVALGLGVFMAVAMTGTLVIQRGIDGPEQAPSVLPVMAVALAMGVAAGMAGWWLQPRHDAHPTNVIAIAPLARRQGERAVWFGRAEMGSVPLAILIGSVALLVVIAAISAVVGEAMAAWITVGTAVFIALLTASLAVFRVRVDGAGLLVRSVAGLVRMRVPSEDVASVGVTHVSALAHYGGFGIRLVPGATAVVLRSGEALEVVRGSGRRFVVTMRGADEAAAVLAAVAEDAHASQG